MKTVILGLVLCIALLVPPGSALLNNRDVADGDIEKYDRREFGYDDREGGFDKREGYEKRDLGFDERKEDYEKREEGYDERDADYDEREEGLEKREGDYDEREETIDESGDLTKRELENKLRELDQRFASLPSKEECEKIIQQGVDTDGKWTLNDCKVAVVNVLANEVVAEENQQNVKKDLEEEDIIVKRGRSRRRKGRGKGRRGRRRRIGSRRRAEKINTGIDMINAGTDLVDKFVSWGRK